ncbi:unnamed protein product [Orchesella dallaii]|uniref:Cyclic nucleotide-binding domain-containing protein n=1 Tax=Orchesella dallaii TaxID=48710 RepID=A0ABP1Q8J6_9HEXA
MSSLSFSLLATLLILHSAFLDTANANSGAGRSDDRFEVYEACQIKYGFLPVNPLAPTPPPTPPGTKKYVDNKPLDECKQMYYRQKFCRNQLRELKGVDYQRICKKFNNHNLKFFATTFGMIGIGALLRTLIKVFKINLPYTVLLMMIGMGLGALSNIRSLCSTWTPYTDVARTEPKIILYVFLPILIFESSFNMKAHLFFRSSISILILALPGMVLTTFTTALLCQQFFFSYNWSFMVAALFGCIISATDPVAVVSILKEVGTSETLGILVDGESLLNDGVAILFYEIFSEIVQHEGNGATEEGRGMKIFIMFMRITLGGPFFGWFMAKITIRYLSMIFNDAAVEVSVTLCSAFLTYFIGEAYLGVSGVMALVLLGITLSSERTCISPEVQGLVSHFWEMLGYLSNTVLFVLVGILITETAVNSFRPEDGYYLVFLYFAINIIRFLMIGLVSPLLSRIGYGLSWQNMVVMTWGGLRGAVGICLALQTFRDKEICEKDYIGPKILLQTAGIVILTLTVNGTTTKKLLDMLKLTELSIGKIQDMANAVRQIRSAQQKALRILRHDRFLADANWTNVEESTNIVNPYVEMHVKAKEEEDDMAAIPSLLDDIGGGGGDGEKDAGQEPSNDEIKEMTEEARLRLLKALKVSCWRQYEQGILTKEAVQILVDVLESTEDKKFQMVHTRDFERYWEIDGFFVLLRKKVLPFSTGSFEKEEHPVPKEPWRHCYHRIACSFTFSTIIYFVIICNMVPVVWETYYIVINHDFNEKQHIVFFLANLFFTLIYLLEFGVKIAGIGFGEYLSSKWNVADCIILIISVVEVILSGTYLEEAIAQSYVNGASMKTIQEADFIKFVRFIRLARVTRILRFFKPLLPLFMSYLNNQVNKRIFLGYDIGKGFVAALDDVQKFLPQMVDHPRVLLKFKWNLENQRVEVVRKMGLLQKDHPEIAIAVKTRHASRAVLNSMRDSLLELKEDGLVDEKEFNAVHEEIEQKMKHLWDSPAYMKTSSAELSLANVAWMAMSSGSKELYEFIHKQATLLTYTHGDTICDVYDKPNGVYIIVSGLIKIHYEPTFEMITEREDYGVIPNMEVFQDLTFENDMDDYFSTGTVIGELGVVTDQPRAAKVTCETGVIAYHIPQSVMKTAMTAFDDSYDSLEARIWRTCGMRLAASLLPTEPAFASWTMDKVKTYLELSAVPIGEKYDELVIPDFVADVVVIYGQVCNYENMDEVFTAPCLIPQTCYHINSKPGSSVPARILIIASQDMEHLAEEDEDENADGKHGDTSGSSLTLHRVILAGTKVTSLTEAEALGIHLQRQSRAVNFGVVSLKPEASKAGVNKQNP